MMTHGVALQEAMETGAWEQWNHDVGWVTRYSQLPN